MTSAAEQSSLAVGEVCDLSDTAVATGWCLPAAEIASA